jgi:hypothetical protein
MTMNNYAQLNANWCEAPDTGAPSKAQASSVSWCLRGFVTEIDFRRVYVVDTVR